MRTLRTVLAISGLLISAACAQGAHGHGATPGSSAHEHKGGIKAGKTDAAQPDFDIVHARITTEGKVATFHMSVVGRPGATTPKPTGAFAGAQAYAYVWPTTLDPYEVGFERGAGILSLAVTSHPDFDDTPLFDETRDGDLANDGGLWHMHWVVLGKDDACGTGALKVIDIPEGSAPRLPATWPGAPILIDSPGWQPVLTADKVEVRVPFHNIKALEDATFDGVTAGLRVNQSVHAPLLCVANVFDVASGDLSLPGRPNN
jgi:hypothetical protein